MQRAEKGSMRHGETTRLFGWALALGLLTAPALDAQDRWVVMADHVYTAAGDAIEGGTVVVEGDGDA